MLRQVLHQGCHGLIETFTVSHVFKADCGLRHKLAHIVSVLLHRIALKGLRGHLRRGSGRIRFLFSMQKGSLQSLGKFPVFRRRLVCIIVQQAVHQKALVKIGREKFPVKSAVHIKHRDALLLGHKLIGGLIGERFHIVNDGCHGRRILCPVRNHFRLLLPAGVRSGFLCRSLVRRVSRVFV